MLTTPFLSRTRVVLLSSVSLQWEGVPRWAYAARAVVHLLTTERKCILVSTFSHSARGLRNALPILIQRLELRVLGMLPRTLQGGLFDETLTRVAPKRIS
jgi:hypothetical protein